MADDTTAQLAAQIAALVETAAADRIAAAREEGYRAGYTEGRREARIEMNERLRALIYEPTEAPLTTATATAVPEPPKPNQPPPAPTARTEPVATADPPPEPEPAAPPAFVPRQPSSVSAPVAPRAANDWRTDERKAELTRRYAAGEDMTVIRLALAEMDGARVPDRNAPLWGWVSALNLRRDTPSEPLAQPTRAMVRAAEDTSRTLPIAPPPTRTAGTNPMGAAAKLPPPSEDGKIYASFAEIRAWAGAYGIAYDGTQMDRVNKLRAAKSLPPLVQRES